MTQQKVNCNRLIIDQSLPIITIYANNFQVIRFGHDWDPMCMKMDEVLYNIAEKVKNFAVIYLVDITKVPDFNKMYVYKLNTLLMPTKCTFIYRL